MSKHRHIPRLSGAGIRQTFGDHPWRARLRAALDGKPTTKAAAALIAAASEVEVTIVAPREAVSA